MYAGKKTRVMLGKLPEISREQARQKLDEIISRDTRIRGQLRPVLRSDLCVDTPWGAFNTQAAKAQSRGAISELIVTVDLLAKGIQVYRAVSPGAPCDLLALLPDGSTLRLEVKTGKTGTDGEIYADITRNAGKFDVLAVVAEDGRPRYRAATQISDLCRPLIGGESDESIPFREVA